MAQVTTTAGWMTSFIYEQDLTSLYMNNTFTGALRPGVYNANLGIVQTSTGDVYLFVKKGTTFLFSNAYKDAGSDCRRSFDSVSDENEDAVLIKCVALKDGSYLLATAADLSVLNVNNSKELFIFTYIEYHSKSSSNALSIPTFVLTTRQDRIDNPVNEAANSHYLYPTFKNIYFTGNGTPISSISRESESYKYMVPDGSKNYRISGSSRTLSSYSFLMLGALVSKNMSFDDINAIKDSPNSWYSAYTFTGHGMPEYRHSMLADQSSSCPDIIFQANSLLENMYIDLPNTYIENVLFNSRPTGPAVSHNKVWEAFYHNSLDITDTAQKVSFTLGEPEKSKLDGSSGPMVVIDMVYGLFASETVGLSESEEVYKKASCSLQLGRYTEIIPKEGSFSPLKWATGKGDSAHILPLDICEDNVRRLLPLIEGKNLWNRLVDHLRVNGNLENNTSLVPIAIGFRFWEEQEDGTYAWQKGVTSDDVVDPAYVIPYIGRAAEVNGVNRITGAFTNINNLIPII